MPRKKVLDAEGKPVDASKDKGKYTTVEGILVGVKEWDSKKGLDIWLFDDANTYFTRKPFPMGLHQLLKLKVRKGTGDLYEKWEIVECNTVNKGHATNPLPLEKPLKKGEDRMVTMKYSQFRELIDSRQVINAARIQAMRSATELYTNSVESKLERNLIAGADKTIEIALRFEAFLKTLSDVEK